MIQINQSTRIIASVKVGSKRNKPNCEWLRATEGKGGRCDLLSVTPTPKQCCDVHEEGLIHCYVEHACCQQKKLKYLSY